MTATLHPDTTSEFLELARQIAAGQQPPEPEISRIVGEAQATRDDLTMLVATLHRRAEYRDMLARAPGLRAEREQLRREIEQANQALQQAQRQHRATVRPASARLDELGDELREADSARRQLADTCPCPRLEAQIDDVVQRQQEAKVERLKLARQAGRIESELLPAAQADKDAPRAEALVARLASLREVMAALQGQVEQLATKLDELVQRRVEW